MRTTTKDDSAGEMVKFSVRVPDKILEKVQIRAIKEKRTLQDLVADALAAYLTTPLKRLGVGK
jgi:predicted transcriptional regulator